MSVSIYMLAQLLKLRPGWDASGPEGIGQSVLKTASCLGALQCFQQTWTALGSVWLYGNYTDRQSDQV
ncbi:unnamed protein product [Protopolystoma xenopodis]|uniref:Uncharacterized protein n=1 Tax=Protopolystoma xenopodis TaxID=117903 RepID=A0A448WZA8_9PLAT|nr:unnamed protein product [Protopolystoma xenopodis]